MSRLLDVAAVLDRMANTLAGTEQGAACEFAVRLMRERQAVTAGDCHEIAQNLRLLNRWRRGDQDDMPMPEPADVGCWIDAAADALETIAQLRQRAEQAEAEIDRWRVATAKLRDGAEEAGRVANMTIAEGADRIEELAAELARVTAQRDQFVECVNKSESVAERGNLVGEVQSLRARVAELEEKAERYRLTTLRQDARVAELEAEIDRWRVATAKLRDGADESARVATEQLARAEQRNAELEAALLEITEVALRNKATTPAKILLVADAALALARAKPAAPACIECGETTRVIREDGRCVVCDYKRHAAPAKHPDTERLLLALTDIATAKGLGFPDGEAECEYVRQVAESAIDAARQEAAS